MNYARIYEAFIQDRLTKQPAAPEYFERHHIKPRCLGGGDEPENIVRLTPEDHSASRLGRTHSQETIAAFSASRAGSGNSRARSVVCETTGEVFGCVKDAAERFGIVSSTLIAALNRFGGDATVKGLQFRKM